ncbi:MAG: tetratricopeptide repeat protein [Cyanobacteria bacterium CAN_BIN43]|nr:tetratricopeptide repeat protein [Cyanobacteria bacterium CAN_BIN43]
MGVSVEVDSATFATEVLEASYQKPVLVDFFAQWCGPCKMLKPMLEALAQEYDFVLAKVDIDQSPDLAHTYKVEGVPDVRVVTHGDVNPGFVGVLPEPQLREFLSNLSLKSELDLGLEAVKAAIAQGDLEQAKAFLGHLINEFPQSQKLAIAAAKFLISQGSFESTEKILATVPEEDREYYPQVKALRELVSLKQESVNPMTHALDEPFFAAIEQVLNENYEAALIQLLNLVSRSRKYRNDGARKAMVMVFELMGDENPLTNQYRRKLTSALY